MDDKVCRGSGGARSMQRQIMQVSVQQKMGNRKHAIDES